MSTARRRRKSATTTARVVVSRPSAIEALAIIERGGCPHCLAVGTFGPRARTHVDTDGIRVKVHDCSACGWEEARPTNATELRKMNALRDLPSPLASGHGSRRGMKMSRLGTR